MRKTSPLSLNVQFISGGKTLINLTVFEYEEATKLVEIGLQNRLEMNVKAKIYIKEEG